MNINTTEAHDDDGVTAWRWAYVPLRRVRVRAAAPGVQVQLAVTAHYGCDVMRKNTVHASALGH